MKAEVIKDFRDRESLKVYRAGETFSGSSKRVHELADGGWVKKPAKRSKK